MASLRSLLSTALLATCVASGTLAQDVAAGSASDPEGETLCVSVARLWSGSIEDVRRIEAVPVPESFRRSFEAGGCTRWSLVEASLTAWHLAFGSERTATEALAYLERGYTAGRPHPRQFREQLSRTWRDALRAIESARLPTSYGPERTAIERRLLTQRAVRHAAELIIAHDDFVDLASQYLHAAEYYESAPLLTKAIAYMPAVRAGLDIVFRGAPIAMADFEAEPNDILDAHTHRINQIHDLDMRIAILRARLSRDPTDIDDAATVLRRNFSAVLETAVQNAYEHGGEICEFHGEADGDALRALELACDEENSLGVRLVNFWRNRAQLDLLMAADPVHYERREQQRREDGSTFVRRAAAASGRETRGWIRSFETAERLLRGRPSDGLHSRWDELQLLLMARADLHARSAQAFFGPERAGDADEQIGQALEYLAQAERATPAHRWPSTYRRVAEAYLRLWDSPATNDNAVWRRMPERIRLAAVFRHTLENLEAITLGEVRR